MAAEVFDIPHRSETVSSFSRFLKPMRVIFIDVRIRFKGDSLRFPELTVSPLLH